MRLVRSFLVGATAIVALTLMANGTPARADGHEHWDHGKHDGWHHGWARPWGGAVVVTPPPLYYTPPPVYYVPPPVAYVPPGISVGIGLNFR